MPGSPAIHFWDMDHTLIDNDCDVSWKTFLVDKGIAPPDALDEADRFFELYKQARLPHDEFMAFQLAEFKGRTLHEIRALCLEHFETIVRPTVFPAAREYVRRQMEAGLKLCLLTATNRYIAEPVAAHFGFGDILATELEMEAGRFTGRLEGEYCGGAKKLPFAAGFCLAHDISLAEAAYYGDSKADIPALRGVGFPVAVNPSPELRAEARAHDWKIIDWTA